MEPEEDPRTWHGRVSPGAERPVSAGDPVPGRAPGVRVSGRSASRDGVQRGDYALAKPPADQMRGRRERSDPGVRFLAKQLRASWSLDLPEEYVVVVHGWWTNPARRENVRHFRWTVEFPPWSGRTPVGHETWSWVSPGATWGHHLTGGLRRGVDGEDVVGGSRRSPREGHQNRPRQYTRDGWSPGEMAPSVRRSDSQESLRHSCRFWMALHRARGYPGGRAFWESQESHGPGNE